MTQLPAYEQLPAAQGVASQKKALRAAGVVLVVGLLLTALLGWNVWRNARMADKNSVMRCRCDHTC